MEEFRRIDRKWPWWSALKRRADVAEEAVCIKKEWLDEATRRRRITARSLSSRRSKRLKEMWEQRFDLLAHLARAAGTPQARTLCSQSTSVSKCAVLWPDTPLCFGGKIFLLQRRDWVLHSKAIGTRPGNQLSEHGTAHGCDMLMRGGML